MLAAEVAALDAVRAAMTARDAHEALVLVETYHRNFPEGQLAPDAEMLAIEALETQGERAEMARRASRFLNQYPNDPHAPRVRLLADR
jgi:outer membrane protein assembly factor BamD (BamD/ComL family)